MRVGVVLFVMLLLVTPAAAANGGSFWSVGKVLRRVDGTSVHVGARTLRIDDATTLCAGYGKSVRSASGRMWQHFNCTYTTFTRALVDKDLDFRLHVRDRTRFVLSQVHWVRGALASGS